MTDEKFNMSMRKFLKQVGVTSQQEIERIVRDGKLTSPGTLKVKVVLTAEGTTLNHVVDGEIVCNRRLVFSRAPLRDPTKAGRNISRCYSCRFAQSGNADGTSEPQAGSLTPRATHCGNVECGQSHGAFTKPCCTGLRWM